jgi:hypothetical protein
MDGRGIRKKYDALAEWYRHRKTEILSKKPATNPTPTVLISNPDLRGERY